MSDARRRVRGEEETVRGYLITRSQQPKPQKGKPEVIRMTIRTPVPRPKPEKKEDE